MKRVTRIFVFAAATLLLASCGTPAPGLCDDSKDDITLPVLM